MKTVFQYCYQALFVTLLLTGCSSAPTNPQAPAANAPAEVQQLHQQLTAAEAQGMNLYAPALYAEIRELYAEASSRSGTPAGEVASRGLTLMSDLEARVYTMQQRLPEVSQARTAAVQAGAADYDSTELEATDAMLRSLAQPLENDAEEQVPAESRDILLKRYRALELASIKHQVLSPAVAALDAATRKEVPLQAPATMAKARQQLDQAASLLDQDRSQTEEAAALAAEVVLTVEHAEALSEQAQSFSGAPSAVEAALLWHEQQTAEAVSPLMTNLPFRQGGETVSAEIRQTLEQTLAEKLALRQSLAAAEQREADLRLESAATVESLRMEMDQKLLAAQMETDAEKRRNAETLRRFEFVRELFAITEAEVFQQGQNVLIRAYGFRFASGSSDIEEDNLPLLNKLIDAIEVFPEPSVQVSGHTDNRGDALLNQRLSEERAANVGEFIANVGSISKERITTTGYGSSRPVASNDSSDGRAANRRVEILIINE